MYNTCLTRYNIYRRVPYTCIYIYNRPEDRLRRFVGRRSLFFGAISYILYYTYTVRRRRRWRDALINPSTPLPHADRHTTMHAEHDCTFSLITTLLPLARRVPDLSCTRPPPVDFTIL
jgi:hypothetical protein